MLWNVGNHPTVQVLVTLKVLTLGTAWLCLGLLGGEFSARNKQAEIRVSYHARKAEETSGWESLIEAAC